VKGFIRGKKRRIKRSHPGCPKSDATEPNQIWTSEYLEYKRVTINKGFLMKEDDGLFSSAISSYYKVFRIVIVLFFLFLISDAFFRWDGFRYYASFSEFIPSLALISVLWAILATFTALMIWVALITGERLLRQIGMRISIDHLMIAIVFSVLLGTFLWKNKQIVSSHFEMSNQLRLIVLTIVTISAIVLTYIVRNKAVNWMQLIQDRITPLVWLFITAIILSQFVVIYHTWIKQPEKSVSHADENSAEDGRDRPNIVLVIYDALTSCDMSGYGYHRTTTPFIDKWAEEAFFFKRLKAASNMTTPSMASLMTGKRVWTHQTYHLKGSKPVKSAVESLPLLLKKNGYYTMAFITNGYASVNELGMENAFDVAPMYSQLLRVTSLFGILEKWLYNLFGEKIKLHDWLIQDNFIFNRILMKFSRDEDITNTPPETVFRRFYWTVEKSTSRPFFAWIHLYPPHDPYLPPKPYKGKFNSSQKLATLKAQNKVKNLGLRYKHTFKDFPPDVKPEIDILRDRYDEYIRYCDSQFEEFIKSLSINNKMDNTIIIFTSDHGESFEHGSIQHSGLHLYEQVTHVPLIIKKTGQKEGVIINDLVAHIDIPATILELAGIQIPPWMEGRSLLPLMHGDSLPAKPIFSMDLTINPSQGKQISNGTIAIWEGDHKLIHYIEQNQTMLFNLKRDPDESVNIFESKIDTGKRLLTIVEDNLNEANDKISSRVR